MMLLVMVMRLMENHYNHYQLNISSCIIHTNTPNISDIHSTIIISINVSDGTLYHVDNVDFQHTCVLFVICRVSSQNKSMAGVPHGQT